MSLETAREHLKKYKLDKEIIIFKESSATVELAAKALNCKEGEIAKTLSFYIDDKPIIIVVAGDKKIDNKKYKDEFHVRAKMIPTDEVKEKVGHEVGGVGPFGLNDGVETYLDVSLKEHKEVYPACGAYNSAIKIRIDKLEKVVDNKKWVDVCK